jgi:hypothetical protein
LVWINKRVVDLIMNELEVNQSRLFHRRHAGRPINQTDIHATQFAVILTSTDSLSRHQTVGSHISHRLGRSTSPDSSSPWSRMTDPSQHMFSRERWVSSEIKCFCSCFCFCFCFLPPFLAISSTYSWIWIIQ